MGHALVALVPAAGSGSRFGEALPKQYHRLLDRSLLEHAVRALARHPAIECVYVVLANDDAQFRTCDWRDLEAKVVSLYCGGPNRAASVFNGLLAVRNRLTDADWVLVHDAARPCVTTAELERLIDEAGADEVGGLLALPMTDTLKRADGSAKVDATEPRDGLWRALTPQMFRYRLLLEALHRSELADITDESSAIERLGLRPRLVMGAATNIKVTYPEDLALARAILEAARAT